MFKISSEISSKRGSNDEMPASLIELLSSLDEQGIDDHRRYAAIRSFLSFRARRAGIPLSGTFELTPLCNLDCKMCYVHLTRSQLEKRTLLTASDWEALMQAAIDDGMMYAKLTGGECLTHPDFKRLYLFLRERGIETGILTNGVLLGRKMADFLKENPPASIQITLYGASDEAYERVTGRRAFSDVLSNIRYIQSLSLPLSIAVTPSAYMTDGEDILRLVRTLGLSAQINCGLMSPRTETGRIKADADLDTYIQLFRLNRALGGTAPVPCDENNLPEPGGETDSAFCGIPCGAGQSGFSLSWCGEMRPCNTFPLICEDARLLGFDEAWKRVREQVLHFPAPAECVHCAYKPRCGCCVSEHASDAPIGHASPLVCARTRRMAAEGLFSL